MAFPAQPTPPALPHALAVHLLGQPPAPGALSRQVQREMLPPETSAFLLHPYHPWHPGTAPGSQLNTSPQGRPPRHRRSEENYYIYLTPFNEGALRSSCKETPQGSGFPPLGGAKGLHCFPIRPALNLKPPAFFLKYSLY